MSGTDGIEQILDKPTVKEKELLEQGLREFPGFAFNCKVYAKNNTRYILKKQKKNQYKLVHTATLFKALSV